MNEDIVIKNDSVSKFRLNTRPPSPDAGRTSASALLLSVPPPEPDRICRLSLDPGASIVGVVVGVGGATSNAHSRFAICSSLRNFGSKRRPKSNIRRFTAAP